MQANRKYLRWQPNAVEASTHAGKTVGDHLLDMRLFPVYSGVVECFADEFDDLGPRNDVQPQFLIDY